MGKVLIIGGMGRLGQALANELGDRGHEPATPAHHSFDIAELVRAPLYVVQAETQWIQLHGFNMVINCAAMLSVPSHRTRFRKLAYKVNALGAEFVAKLTARLSIRLVHISTDYVFDGERGNYDETALKDPVNEYGVSKAMGDSFVAFANPRALIVRAPFAYDGPWPYRAAFTDQWTSRRWMREVVPDIVDAALDEQLVDVMHIGGPRRTVYDLAREVSPDVGKCERKDWTMFELPRDVSLDSSRWERYKAARGAKGAVASAWCGSLHGDVRCMKCIGHDGPHQNGKEVWEHD